MSTEGIAGSEFEQPRLENRDIAYVPPEQEGHDNLVEIYNDGVDQVRADAPGRYLARERERLSRPLSPEAQARRDRMRRLLRPMGAH